MIELSRLRGSERYEVRADERPFARLHTLNRTADTPVTSAANSAPADLTAHVLGPLNAARFPA